MRRTLTQGTGGGELIDRMTRLEIQLEEGLGPAQATQVRQELERLRVRRSEILDGSDDLVLLTAQLKAINRTLCFIEEDMRHQQRHELGQHFVELAHALFINTEQRAALIKRINRLRPSRPPWMNPRTS